MVRFWYPVSCTTAFCLVVVVYIVVYVPANSRSWMFKEKLHWFCSWPPCATIELLDLYFKGHIFLPIRYNFPWIVSSPFRGKEKFQSAENYCGSVKKVLQWTLLNFHQFVFLFTLVTSYQPHYQSPIVST